MGGGFFNQIWTLQGLVLNAAEHNLSLVLPSFDSHLHPKAMGLNWTAQTKPRKLEWTELFEFDCFAAALRAHGLVVLRKSTIDTAQQAASERVSPARMLRNYQRYIGQRSRDETPPNPLEEAIYRALRPSARLLKHVQHWLQSAKLRTDNGSVAHYGCVHARVENDMRRWWYHVGKVRPLTLVSIFELLGTIDTVRRTPTLFVAIGSDIRRSDEELLRTQHTPWNATMVRRATPNDGSGDVVLRDIGVGGRRAPGSGAVGRSASPLTYVEAALVDFVICRSAAWFAGWTSSSFSATVAYIRHLDHPGERYYAYCAGTASGKNASIELEAPAERIRLHTCKGRRRQSGKDA